MPRRTPRSSALFVCLLLSACGSSSEGSEASSSGGDGGAPSSAPGIPSASVGDAPVIDRSAELFEATIPPELHLTLSEEALQALEADPALYQSASFRYVSADVDREITLEEVGVHLKGRASFSPLSGKASFKIKFSEFVDGQRFLGLRRLTLNNMAQDPSGVRERLGYIYFREAGVVAPRSNYARVYLNGEYYGFYANVESLDESFLERHFSPPDGNLYDTSNEQYFVDFVPGSLQWFELETNVEANDRSDLESLAQVVGSPLEDVVSELSAVIDLPQFLKVGAAQAVIADWDGYFGATNNYMLYHEVTSDRFVLLPWGIDQTFNYMAGSYDMLDYTIDGSGSERPNGIVFTHCKSDEACTASYLDAVRAALDVFESLNLMGTLDALLPQIEGPWLEDPRNFHSLSDHQRALEFLREFLTERGDLVRSQLEE